MAEVEVGDSNTNVDRDTALQIGRLNLRLMLERDAGEGYATLGVARVIERRADNKLVLDTQYIPPMLHAQGHPILDGYVRELLRPAAPARRSAGGAAVAARPRRRRRDRRLPAARGGEPLEPVFMQLQQRSVLHPERSTPPA